MYHSFGGAFCLHLRFRRANRTRKLLAVMCKRRSSIMTVGRPSGNGNLAHTKHNQPPSSYHVQYIVPSVYINERDEQIFVNSLYFFVNWLHMFQTIISPKHVEAVNEKIKTIHKNLCISLVYIHIAIRCKVHATSNTLSPSILNSVTVYRKNKRKIMSNIFRK